MKLYEVKMRDTNTGVEVVVDVEATTKADAEKKVRAVYGRPGMVVTEVKDTLFRSAALS